MKRFLTYVLLTSIVGSLLYAQPGLDTLYLKNGSVAIGKLYDLSNGSYQIKTNEGMVFVFSKDEILRFTIAGKPVKTDKKVYDLNRINGLGFVITSSLLLGSSDENFPIYGTQNIMITFAFSPEQVIGLGSGIEIIDRYHIPVFIEYRYGILKRNVTPFVYFRGGKLITIGEIDSGEDNKGGWTIGAGTGFRWPMHNFESYIKLGYRYSLYVEERTAYEYIDNTEYPCTFQHNFHRLEMGWGFRF
ncbi:MAG: hypothetical protein JXR66_03805 [Bacteroidales bacterium]|nr:hypothetical protein [Bacteroidales bacterium]MBN2632656.1 hypothetical protein [Bacteroidales bacterium]